MVLTSTAWLRRRVETQRRPVGILPRLSRFRPRPRWAPLPTGAQLRTDEAFWSRRSQTSAHSKRAAIAPAFDVVATGANEQPTAGRAAGRRRLPLRLREQPRRRCWTTLLVRTKSTTPAGGSLRHFRSAMGERQSTSSGPFAVTESDCKHAPCRLRINAVADGRRFVALEGFRNGRDAGVSVTVARLLLASDISKPRRRHDPRLP